MTVYTQIVNVGSSFEQTFVYTLNDEPVDLTGWGAVFRLRDESDRVISTVRYGDTGDRALTVDASTGVIDVTMVASATSGFTAKTGTFELEIYDLNNTGRVLRIVDGSVRYRPRGRAMLDNTVCVIRSTSNSVTVETQNISQYQRIDRGPPGASGSTGPAGPVIPVTNSAPGAVPRLAAALVRHVSRSDGNALSESLERVPAAAFTDQYADDAARLTAAATTAGAGFKDIQLEAKNYACGYLDMRNFQGVRLHGCGGSSFSTGGTTFTLTGSSPGGDVTGTSASSVSVGSDPRGSVTKSFNIPGLVGVIANYPMKATATSGATATLYGDVVSYDGTTLVLKSLAHTGSGTGTAWSILCTTRPWLDFRSGLGGGLKNVNIIVPDASIHRVIDTSWNLSNIADASLMVFDNVKIRQNSKICRAFYFGTTISVIAMHCSADGAMVGMFAGNGPATLIGNSFTGCSVWSMELVGAENVAISNVFEPGTALNGVSDRLINGCKCGPNAFGTATLIANVFNDAHPDALGDWVYAFGMRSVVSIGNQYQSDAPQAVIRVNGTERLGFYGDVFNATAKGVEVDTSGSTVQSIYKSPDVSFPSGGTWLTGGSSVVDSVDSAGTITRTDGSAITGLVRNFAKFYFFYGQFGCLTPATPVNLVTGVDLSLTSGNAYNSYSSGSGFIYTIAAIDDGLCIDFVNTQAQTVTIKNNNTTGSAGGIYRPVLTGTGADVVIPAGSATTPKSWRIRYRSLLGAFVLENVYP